MTAAKKSNKAVTRTFKTEFDGLVLVCIAALLTDRFLFTKLLTNANMTYSLAQRIMSKIFTLHPEWIYLCQDAYVKCEKKLVKELLSRYLFFCDRYEQQVGPPLHCSATAIVLIFTDHGLQGDYSKCYDTYKLHGLSRALDIIHVETTTFDEERLLRYVETESGSSPGLMINPSISTSSTSSAAAAAVGDDASADKVNQKVEMKKSLPLDNFKKFCTGQFGVTRKVVIKFMSDAVQHRREVDLRHNAHLDPKYVLALLDPPNNELFINQIKQGRVAHISSLYSHGLVMEAADRSLDAIFRSERPSISTIRAMMYEIGLAIQHCHDRGIVHADLKMLNVLRVHGHMHLIDIDAAVEMDGGYVGSKFSSGILPPEMFVKLSKDEVKRVEAYWMEGDHECCKGNDTQWLKVAPRTVITKKNGYVHAEYYAVRAYHITNNSSSTHESAIAAELATAVEGAKVVKASSSIDRWAFGLMLFTLVTGQYFLTVNRDDDLTEPDDYWTACCWTRDSLMERVYAASSNPEEKDTSALTLILSLLEPSSLLRSQQTMADYLYHPFFQDNKSSPISVQDYKESKGPASGIDDSSARQEMLLNKLLLATEKQTNMLLEQMKMIDEVRQQNNRILDQTMSIVKMSDDMLAQIAKTERVLLRGMFEAADVIVPSCFIIVNRKLEQPTTAEESDVISTISSPSALLSKGAQLLASPQFETAKRWMKKIAKVTSLVCDVTFGDNPDQPSLVASAVDRLMDGETLHLYLVNEYTMLPVTSQEFEIKEPRKIVPKILPLMKLGLRAVRVYNTGANIAHCFGFPVPVLSDQMMEEAKAAIGKLEMMSTVGEFDALQRMLDDRHVNEGTINLESQQAKSLRGLALRDFARFLATVDTTSNFAGLRRVASADGTCCWTLPKNVDEIEQGKVKTATSKTASLEQQVSATAVPASKGGEEESAAKLSAISDVTIKADVSKAGMTSANTAAAGQASLIADSISSTDNVIIHHSSDEILRLQSELSLLIESNKRLSQTNEQLSQNNERLGETNRLLAETIPKSLHTIRTDIVKSVDKVIENSIVEKKGGLGFFWKEGEIVG